MKKPDGFVLSILAAFVLGTIVPLSGTPAVAMDWAVAAAIFWLFFLYGVKIAPAEAGRALRNWRLHSLVVAATYVLFPLMGLAVQLLPTSVLSEDLQRGVLFLCLLPSTVQSSVTFTSIARGNVAGAISAASLSNLAGVFLTPLLAAALLGGALVLSPRMVGEVAAQLLLPFVLGQLSRRWVAGWVKRNGRATTFSDRAAIALAVFAAASHARAGGVWATLQPVDLAWLLAVLVGILVAGLGLTWLAGRAFGLPREDRVVLLMCGSKKSLASGVPMATVLLPAAAIGPVVVPIVLFHQIQLMACSEIARRWGAAPDAPAADVRA